MQEQPPTMDSSISTPASSNLIQEIHPNDQRSDPSTQNLLPNVLKQALLASKSSSFSSTKRNKISIPEDVSNFFLQPPTQSEEDVQKYIQERRNKFPTRTKIETKQLQEIDYKSKGIKIVRNKNGYGLMKSMGLTKETNPSNTTDEEVSKRELTKPLLQKLIRPEIQRETSILLQVVRYLVNEQFLSSNSNEKLVTIPVSSKIRNELHHLETIFNEKPSKQQKVEEEEEEHVEIIEEEDDDDDMDEEELIGELLELDS